MAKTATKTAPARTPVKNTGKSVTTKAEGAVVSQSLADKMASKGRAGVSSAMDDNVVPLIYILQYQSPQVLKKNEKYVQGAEAGMAWFRGTHKVVDTENEGMLVQPCFFSRCWIEWMPDRGGFVERHAERPDDAVLRTDPKNPKKKYWERPNGNTVVDTREHVVLVHGVFDHPTPFVIPMSGSQHSASKNWTTLMNRTFLPDGRECPSYACIYRMKTVAKSNDAGDWYMWEIGYPDGEAPTYVENETHFDMADNIFKSFTSGAMRAGDLDSDNDEAVAGSNAAGDNDDHI